MPISKHLITSLYISLLLMHLLVEAKDEEMSTNVDRAGGSSYVPRMNCAAACEARCRLASRQNLCKRACGTCCARCNCVPPGTSGNHHLCPCYEAMTTHGGRRKCP
ncbi:snakin-2-like [Sesamum indicum]|uniref:Snakin-2-like n=1 Tax=Sesamum indicum TaxID=4182 RepID=A0A6I9T332_SESIN|nr:snakin-2-like [Sesamum indicum]